MGKVVSASAYLVDLEVETPRHDAVQSFVKQETVFVEITTDDGHTGLGYSYTIGTGGRAVVALLRTDLLPRLHGREAGDIEAVWSQLYAVTRATSIGVVTALALAAVDTALWDIRCQRAGEPLWRMAGGYRQEVPVYDTEGGWLQLPTEELVRGALAARDAGWTGVKVKVGKPRVATDVARIAAVRAAVGPELEIMVDANQSLTVADATRRARAFEELDVAWFEEPLPADDVSGHAALARASSVPVAVGESLYSLGQFRAYLEAGAVGIVQVDVARIGGITPWLKVAHLAEAFNVKVAPHFLMELHVSLAAAVPNGLYVEHIPQLRAITTEEMRIVDGHAVASDSPGLGIAWDLDAINDRRVA
ncbi:mandelate racemase/muconate lactonizing enzyme family protein [Actinopolymorpha pittospori]|uniref:L-alanine-DL-glutamate epimerase-like enolase superfamily enzyme n=1 Tax=Actinopolymorpha pittospori TaxID=648752 RepID=A0A927MT12_9ACTN|nr:mandelate racemase/muconate lactonizing enzyme family protein [Actinopolymorpha pittospori]MBE1606099.1 L-alanine-DL-glutamate epimerase-like enolase superfamily enzyme [Actinopolymorpha pittospori]